MSFIKCSGHHLNESAQPHLTFLLWKLSWLPYSIVPWWGYWMQGNMTQTTPIRLCFLRITFLISLLWEFKWINAWKVCRIITGMGKQYVNVNFYYYETERQKIRKWFELEHSIHIALTILLVPLPWSISFFPTKSGYKAFPSILWTTLYPPNKLILFQVYLLYNPRILMAKKNPQ